MNKILLLAAFCLLSACNPASAPANLDSAPLAGARLGGDFTLTDQKGKQATWKGYAGKFRIIYFGYTFCPDVCPVDVQVIGKALSLLEKQDAKAAANLVPIFITADPARDTPEALKAFLANFHPRFVGLTGPVAEIDRLAPVFGGVIEREKPNAQGAYLVNHARFAALYGPQGQPVAMLPIEQGAEATATELRRWVR